MLVSKMSSSNFLNSIKTRNSYKYANFWKIELLKPIFMGDDI